MTRQMTTTSPRFSRMIADPFNRLRGDIDAMLQDFPSGRRMFDWGNAAFPAVDLADEEKAFRLSAEVPGFKRDQLDVSYADGCLTLKGERSESTDQGNGGMLFRERSECRFERQIPLPVKIDASQIDASLKDGVLEVTLPKADDPSRKTIPINIS